MCLVFYFLHSFPVFRDVPISDISVAIYVSGPHRRDVLDAVSFLIEQLKTNVPIWKKVMFSFFQLIRLLPHHIWIYKINSITLCRSSTRMITTTTTTTTAKHQSLVLGKKINDERLFVLLGSFYFTSIQRQNMKI